MKKEVEELLDMFVKHMIAAMRVCVRECTSEQRI
jgi:hypothetical protein